MDPPALPRLQQGKSCSVIVDVVVWLLLDCDEVLYRQAEIGRLMPGCLVKVEPSLVARMLMDSPQPMYLRYPEDYRLIRFSSTITINYCIRFNIFWGIFS